MANWAELTNEKGKPVLVNFDRVMTIDSSERTGGARIRFSREADASSLVVQETYEYVRGFLATK